MKRVKILMFMVVLVCTITAVSSTAFSRQGVFSGEVVDGFDAVVSMIERNDGKDMYLRHAGIVALVGVGGADQLIDHPSEEVRLCAVVALRRVRDARVVAFLKDESESVVREAVLERSKANGQVNKDFSMYAQPKARALSTPTEVKYVTDNFEPKLNAVLSQMKSEMAGRDDITLTMQANGTINVDARPDMNTGNQIIPFKQDTSGQFKANVRRLETYNKLVTNGWAGDLKRDPSSFLGKTIDNLNKSIPDNELAPVKASRRRYNPSNGSFEDIQ